MAIDTTLQNKVNFFNATYVGATTSYIYLVKGAYVFNWTNGSWDALNPSGTTTFGAAHRVVNTGLYNNATQIGIRVNLTVTASGKPQLPADRYELMFYDDTVIDGTETIEISSTREVTVL